MIKERRVATEWSVSGPINDGAGLARTRTLETTAGILLLQDHCQPSFVESLRVDSGLRAFARLPEREHQLLVNIAKRSDCRLTLAYTPEGIIVAEVTLAPGDAWWAGLEHVYEGAVQVSSNWRRLGIARQLLSFALELDMLEDMVIFALGLSWHWDTEGLGLNRYQYRKLIESLFAAYGFVEYLTSEPNITMDPANIFLARIGSRVNLQTINQFYNRMLNSQNLPGV
jgi:GNAT superfamily N-acetyltransferase